MIDCCVGCTTPRSNLARTPAPACNPALCAHTSHPAAHVPLRSCRPGLLDRGAKARGMEKALLGVPAVPVAGVAGLMIKAALVRLSHTADMHQDVYQILCLLALGFLQCFPSLPPCRMRSAPAVRTTRQGRSARQLQRAGQQYLIARCN